MQLAGPRHNKYSTSAHALLWLNSRVRKTLHFNKVMGAECIYVVWQCTYMRWEMACRVLIPSRQWLSAARFQCLGRAYISGSTRVAQQQSIGEPQRERVGADTLYQSGIFFPCRSWWREYSRTETTLPRQSGNHSYGRFWYNSDSGINFISNWPC